MSMLKEFKAFISKGNVLDLAVGVIIGGAFGKIVSSLVNDIIMPAIGIISGGINFENLKITVGDAAINYGMFIQTVVDFLIISLAIFLFIKLLSKLRREKPKAEAPKTPPREEQLLEEIRDILKERSAKV
ncbi:MAG: large-conductance mechanosensitive channel protein MscL [Burkholderiales bacterium]